MRSLDSQSEIEAQSCCSNAPLREVLARFNSLTHPFCLVVNEDGRLVGTVTDGDVRRALLKGAALDDAIENIMNRKYTALSAGAALPKTERPLPFLPMLDKEGRVKRILLAPDVAPQLDWALVMAGGLGSRLGDLTKQTPKPLLEVGGKPMLEHVLSGLERAGASKVFIAVHYLADQIADFVAGRDSRVDISLVSEPKQLGTAGALGLLPQKPEKPILVTNSDVVSSVDFGAVREYHDRHGLDATICVARYDVPVPYGVIRHSPDGLFAGIDEKPVLSNFIAAGIYCLAPELCNLVHPGRAMDMPALLNQARGLGARIGLFPLHEDWADIGQPLDLERARRRYAEGK